MIVTLTKRELLKNSLQTGGMKTRALHFGLDRKHHVLKTELVENNDGDFCVVV